jgi:HSP20 family protein
MELRLLAPFFDLDKEWRMFDLPRILRDTDGMAFRPSTDLIKEDGELKVTVELPGIDLEDVDVSLDGKTLIIKGEKTEEKEISDDDRFLHERIYGNFQRRIPLPDGVSADKVRADYDKGVLTVSVTLPEEVTPEPRQIPVEVKTAS